MNRQNTHAEFSATRWTLVDAVTGDNEALRQSARRQLAEQYFSPVYAYIRSRGNPPDRAGELTQSFFTEVIYGRDLFGRVDRRQARLRSYLKVAITNHIVDQSRKERRHVSSVIPASALAEEERNFRDLKGLSAEEAFDIRWTVAVLQEALKRCRARFVDAGQEEQFLVFERWFCRYLGTDTSVRPDATELAKELGLSNADQVYSITRRVRQRLQEAVREVLRDQVGEEDQLQEELLHFARLTSIPPQRALIFVAASGDIMHTPRTTRGVHFSWGSLRIGPRRTYWSKSAGEYCPAEPSASNRAHETVCGLSPLNGPVMSTYSPDRRESSSTSVLKPEPPRGEATSRLRKLCDCTRALAQISSRSAQTWLDQAAFTLSQAFGAEVGVYLLLGRWDTERQRWRLLASAQYTDAFEILTRSGLVLLERWPDDEYSLAAGHTAYPPKTGMGRLPELVPPQVWERCAYRRLRLSHGLRGAARWLGRTSREDTPETLLVQLEDPRHADGPSDEVLEELAALAPQLLSAYQDAFLLPELRRLRAFDRLTPAQQRVAQLLYQGLSQVDIAKQLGRKYHTVRGHVKGIYDRLGVHSRDEFAQLLGCPPPQEYDAEFEAVESYFESP